MLEFSETLPHYVEPPYPGYRQLRPVLVQNGPSGWLGRSQEFVVVAVLPRAEWTTVLWRAVEEGEAPRVRCPVCDGKGTDESWKAIPGKCSGCDGRGYLPVEAGG